MRILLTTLTVACLLPMLNAQQFEAGISFAGAVYSGDLSPKVLPRYTRFIKPMGGLVMRYRNDGVLGVRASLNYGKLSGDDTRSAHPGRKLSFQTNLLELAVVGEWYLVPDYRIGDEGRLTPYIFLGIAGFHFDPEVIYESGIMALQPVGTEGQGMDGYPRPYRRTQLAIPLGAGLRFKASERGVLGLELSFRKLFTDYLDDVSGEYLNYLKIYEEKGEVAASLSRPGYDPINPSNSSNIYRRGGDKNDSYGSIALTYTYRLSR
jgi:opacity protein-like surface antigen